MAPWPLEAASGGRALSSHHQAPRPTGLQAAFLDVPFLWVYVFMMGGAGTLTSILFPRGLVKNEKKN